MNTDVEVCACNALQGCGRAARILSSRNGGGTARILVSLRTGGAGSDSRTVKESVTCVVVNCQLASVVVGIAAAVGSLDPVVVGNALATELIVALAFAGTTLLSAGRGGCNGTAGTCLLEETAAELLEDCC